ncbi:hypothetical protein [uncultured Pseudacidovorax sp.]|uniref:hypothetical protein n=1 Tax=uncultured Pseudacidovorax sp. TaxID=679313 RepID=UPI0025DC98A6|nr:hypothetical protein [uncultured Pseudacidovorax sp.]
MSKARISNDGEVLRLKVDNEFNASELEDLVHDLARQRAKMTPTVPERVEDAARQGIAALDHGSTSVTAGTLVNGKIPFFVRSGGLGWLSLHLSARDAHLLGQHLVAQTPRVVELALGEIGDTKAPH